MKGDICLQRKFDLIVNELKKVDSLVKILHYNEEGTDIFTMVITDEQIDCSSIFSSLYWDILEQIGDCTYCFDLEYVLYDYSDHYPLPTNTTILYEKENALSA